MKLAVFWAYAKSVKVYLAVGIVLFIVLAEIASVASGIWLASWSSANVTSDAERDMYLGVYGGLGVTQATCVLISSLCLAVGSKIASRYLHENLFEHVMHSPMSFFETTPLGRIVNRFSKDISTIDDQVPVTLATFIRTLSTVIGTIIAISFATPIFLVVIVPLGIVYVLIQVIFHSRDLKIEVYRQIPQTANVLKSREQCLAIRFVVLRFMYVRQTTPRSRGR